MPTTIPLAVRKLFFYEYPNCYIATKGTDFTLLLKIKSNLV